MPPSFRSASTGWSNGGTTLTVAKPSGVVDGDAMVAAVTLSNNSATLTPPAGWTELDDSPVTSTPAGDDLLYMYYKFASSEGASYAFTLSTGLACSGAITAYSSASAIDQQEMIGYGVDGSSATTPTLSPSVNDTVLVAVFGVDVLNVEGPEEFTFTSPYTKRADVSDTSSFATTSIGDCSSEEGVYSATASISGSARPIMTGIINIKASSPSTRNRKMLTGVGA